MLPRECSVLPESELQQSLRRVLQKRGLLLLRKEIQVLLHGFRPS